jgi:hypothetical protein
MASQSFDGGEWPPVPRVISLSTVISSLVGDIISRPKLIRVPIGFPSELHQWLQRTSTKVNRSMGSIVREAVTEYRQRVEPQLELPISTEVSTRRKDLSG